MADVEMVARSSVRIVWVEGLFEILDAAAGTRNCGMGRRRGQTDLFSLPHNAIRGSENTIPKP